MCQECRKCIVKQLLLNIWLYNFRSFSLWNCCRKADPFQGPKLGCCLTLRSELSEETHVLTKQEILLGKGTQVESSRVREPRRTALPRGSQCRVLWWWDLFPGGLWSIILIQSLSWWRTQAQPRWMLARGILGSGRTRSVSFRPFSNSSIWWWLISSVFLIRISCHKTTHANGYYGTCPGWVVSISVLPLTIGSLWIYDSNHWMACFASG